MGFLADKTVFSPLTQKMLDESEQFSCGNEDLDGFFLHDAVSYAENLFGKSYCYTTEWDKCEIVCAFTISNASIFTRFLPNVLLMPIMRKYPLLSIKRMVLILCSAPKNRKRNIGNLFLTALSKRG